MTTEARDFDKDAARWDEHPTRVQLAQDVASAIARAVPLGPTMGVLDVTAAEVVKPTLQGRSGRPASSSWPVGRPQHEPACAVRLAAPVASEPLRLLWPLPVRGGRVVAPGLTAVRICHRVRPLRHRHLTSAAHRERLRRCAGGGETALQRSRFPCVSREMRRLARSRGRTALRLAREGQSPTRSGHCPPPD